MLKLKYLFDNRDLAIMLLENWDYNRDRVDALDHFRISANAVYPFFMGGAPLFLRSAPAAEKNEKDLLAELDFLRYLREEGVHAAEAVLTKDGRECVAADTPWGKYYAVAFKGVEGKRMDQMGYSDELFFGMGKTLGAIHRRSAKYTAKRERRPDWKDRLEWVISVLTECSAPEKSFREAELLMGVFGSLPVSPDIYGLIHYDFELDNVFYDARSEAYSVIDFDDAVYHWFVMDIEQSLDSIRSELPDERKEQAPRCFLSGYRSEKHVDGAMLGMMPACRRYADLYGYARILRSVHESWKHEPEWMRDLRGHLHQHMKKRAMLFGEEIRV